MKKYKYELSKSDAILDENEPTYFVVATRGTLLLWRKEKVVARESDRTLEGLAKKLVGKHNLFLDCTRGDTVSSSLALSSFAGLLTNKADSKDLLKFYRTFYELSQEKDINSPTYKVIQGTPNGF